MQAKKRRNQINPFFSASVVLVLALLACGGTAGVTSTPKPAATVVATAAPASRCVPASDAQMEAIRAGVKGIQASNDVRAGWAVRSKDFECAWFVAAKIYGPGAEKGTGPGVWVMSGDPDKPGMVFSVDAFAREFSDWADGTKTSAGFAMTRDGAQEAKDCAAGR